MTLPRIVYYRVSTSMGTSRRSGSGNRTNAGVLKERANMSFMLVVMFFAVFGLIVLTEIFLIDERRGVSVAGTGVLGGHRSGHRLPAAPDRPDYGEVGVSSIHKEKERNAIYSSVFQ